MNFLIHLFNNDGFMPHGHCYLWISRLLWLNVVSDLIIFLAYLSIPITLLYILKKKGDLPFNWIFCAFSVFILACGTSHLMEIWTIWSPVYWQAALVKVITAMVSIVTAGGLIKLIPAVLNMPGQQQLTQLNNELLETNTELQREIAARSRVEQEQKLIFDHVGTGVAFIRHRQFVRCNQHFADMFGYPVETLLGTSTRILFSSDDLFDHIGKQAYALIAEGLVFSMDIRLQRKDGTLFWVDLRASAIDAADPVGGVICVAHDIDQRKHGEQALRESDNRFRCLMELSSDWYWEQDKYFRYTKISIGVHHKGIVAIDQFLGKTNRDFFAGELPEDWVNHKAVLDAHRIFFDVEYKVRFDDASLHWFRVSGEPLFDADGEFTGYRGTGKDITYRKKLELLRADQGNVLEMIATSMQLEMILIRLMQLIEAQMEDKMGSIVLLEEDQLHLRMGAAPSLPSAYLKEIDGMRIGPKAGSCGTALYRREAVLVSDVQTDPLWEDCRYIAEKYDLRSCWSVPLISHQGRLLGALAVYSRKVCLPTAMESQVIAMATRIAGIAIERRDTEERIRHMAHHDALTGLPNRSLLEDRLSQAILLANRFGRRVTVAFLDLDNFKPINDSLGHNAGDQVLKVVSERMQHSLRATDTVVRLGGDEFVIILLDHADNTEGITHLLQHLRDIISQPIDVSGHYLEVTCSMGVATYPGDGINAETLLMNADVAMYRAKELGRNNCQFYTSEMNLSKVDTFRSVVSQS